MKRGTSTSTHIQNGIVCQDKKIRAKAGEKKEYRLLHDRSNPIPMATRMPLEGGEFGSGIWVKGQGPAEWLALFNDWCRRSESNRHEREARRILSPLRLPISPLRLRECGSVRKGGFVVNQNCKMPGCQDPPLIGLVTRPGPIMPLLEQQADVCFGHFDMP